MKLSVVIPAYNEETCLKKALQSLKKQTFAKKDFEVIVVDNNSTDNTNAIARQFANKVVFEQKRGIAYARQTGAKAATGDIIVGIDADGEVPKDFLQKIAIEFKDKSLVGLCGTISFGNAPLVIKIGARLFSWYAHYYSKIFRQTPICWALNFSFRRNVFEQIGGYNLSLPLLKAGINTQGADESDLVKRLSTYGHVLFNKNISLATSGRRFNNRLFYWFFVELIGGFYVNPLLYALFGFWIKMPSYYNRKNPRLTQI
jgi:glycosyltransferase involved in cell wall biosynthesis